MRVSRTATVCQSVRLSRIQLTPPPGFDFDLPVPTDYITRVKARPGRGGGEEEQFTWGRC